MMTFMLGKFYHNFKKGVGEQTLDTAVPLVHKARGIGPEMQKGLSDLQQIKALI